MYQSNQKRNVFHYFVSEHNCILINRIIILNLVPLKVKDIQHINLVNLNNVMNYKSYFNNNSNMQQSIFTGNAFVLNTHTSIDYTFNNFNV